MIEAVLLDLGDTLVHLSRPWDDVFHANLQGLYSYLTSLGFKIDSDRFADTFVRTFEDASSKADLYKIEIPMEDIIAKVLRKSKLEVIGQDLIRNATEEFYRPEIGAWEVYPDTIQTLSSLKNESLKTGLISNAKSDWAVHAILEKNKISEFFDDVVTSAVMRLRKPRPEVFARALNDLNVKASETVFIGDSLEADVGGARKAGMRSIHVIRKPVDSPHAIRAESSVTSLTDALHQIDDWKNGSQEKSP